MSRDAKTTKQTIRTLHLFPWRRYDSPALAAATSNHVLCNVIGGAVAPTQRLLPGVSTWRFSPPRDSALADACRIGLRFDVLSAKLEQEHTGGVHCMQVAFNVPAHAAMLVHELQIVKQLAEVCTSASDVTGEVRLETTRAFRRRRPSLRDLKLVPALVAVCCGSVGASFCPRQPTVALRALCATGGSITLDRST